MAIPESKAILGKNHENTLKKNCVQEKRCEINNENNQLNNEISSPPSITAKNKLYLPQTQSDNTISGNIISEIKSTKDHLNTQRKNFIDVQKTTIKSLKKIKKIDLTALRKTFVDFLIYLTGVLVMGLVLLPGMLILLISLLSSVTIGLLPILLALFIIISGLIFMAVTAVGSVYAFLEGIKFFKELFTVSFEVIKSFINSGKEIFNLAKSACIYVYNYIYDTKKIESLNIIENAYVLKDTFKKLSKEKKDVNSVAKDSFFSKTQEKINTVKKAFNIVGFYCLSFCTALHEFFSKILSERDNKKKDAIVGPALSKVEIDKLRSAYN